MRIIRTWASSVDLVDDGGERSAVVLLWDGHWKCLRCNHYYCAHVAFVERECSTQELVFVQSASLVMPILIDPFGHASLHLQVHDTRNTVTHVYRTWDGMPYGANFDPAVGIDVWSCLQHGHTNCIHVQVAKAHLTIHTDEMTIALHVSRKQHEQARRDLSGLIDE